MARTRRDKGEGSIRQRKDGTWEGRYTFTNDDGIKKTKSVYASSQSELKRKLKELIYNMENINDSDWTEETKMTVSEWLDTWVQNYKKNSIAPSTYSSYTSNINEHIRPAIGTIQLQKLRPEHIQKLLNNMGKANSKRSGLSSATIIKVKNIISGAMEQAIKSRIIQFNPTKAVIAPKLEYKEVRVLTEEEQYRFMEACRGHRLEALYLLALATGMRRGEILALTWDCVDFKNQSISVKSSMSRIKDPDTGVSSLVFSEPKTKAGRRKIPILNSMIVVLQDHKKRQQVRHGINIILFFVLL